MGIFARISAMIWPASATAQAAHSAILEAHQAHLEALGQRVEIFVKGHNQTALSFLNVFERLTNLEKSIMTEQASLDALTTKVTALESIVATVQGDVANAVTELGVLKAEVVALQANPAGTDNSAAINALAARIDTITAGLTSSALNVETAVTAAKA